MEKLKKTMNDRISQLEVEIVQHQQALFNLDQQRNELIRLIHSKQGGIIELRQILQDMEKGIMKEPK